MKYVFSSTDVKRYRFPTHINELVIDRSESAASEVFFVQLARGEAPPCHKHDDAEQLFYMLEGCGTLVIGDGKQVLAVKPGDIVRIPPKVLHTLRADCGEPVRYLAIDCFTGGPSKSEPTWDAHVLRLCKEHGWDYESVRRG